MQDWPKINDAMQHVDIVLFDRFSNHCLANTVEPLRAANTLAQRTLYHWRFCTLDGAPVRSSSGLDVAPHHSLAEAAGTALVLLPSYGVHGLDRAEVVRAVRRAAQQRAVIGGFDTGAWLMARAGLLDGHRATVHPDAFDAFAEAFPQVDAVEARYVLDGARITCSGAMAAFDLVVQMVTAAHGPLLGRRVARLFNSHLPNEAMPMGRSVRRALDLMQAHVDAPLPVAEIARAVGCTQKTLAARMRRDLKASPRAVYQHVRLSAALAMVQDGDAPIAEVAARCGYLNASAMTRAFRAAYGQSPSTLRQAML